MKAFKRHMIQFADHEGFLTLCGIDDSCSDEFFDDPNTLVEFGNYEDTTCKKCLQRWEKEKAIMEEMIKEHSYPVCSEHTQLKIIQHGYYKHRI